jgi:hypothetical protein
MTTRLELRTMVRRRLADTSVDPLWDDALLNDAIAAGIRRYSARVPRQATTTVAVGGGDRIVVVPPEINPLRVVRVFDDAGTLWPRWEGPLEQTPVPNGPPGDATWRVWGQELVLAHPAPRSGGWRIEHLTHRTPPADDTTPLDMQAGDDDLLIAQTIAIALERRAIADGKQWTGRGPVHPLAAAARSAQMDADRLFWERLRRARGGYLEERG